jgi:hypothetical protein
MMSCSGLGYESDLPENNRFGRYIRRGTPCVIQNDAAVSNPLSAHLYLADGILIVQIGEYQKEMADGFARLKRDNEGDRLEDIRKRVFDDVKKERTKNEKGLSITTPASNRLLRR